MQGSNLDPRFLRHVKARYPDLDDLLEAAESVAGLMDQPGWGLLYDLVGDELQTIERKLDHGDAPLGRAQYAMAHGRRGGMLFAGEMARTLMAHAQEELARQRRKHEGGAESSPGRQA